MDHSSPTVKPDIYSGVFSASGKRRVFRLSVAFFRLSVAISAEYWEPKQISREDDLQLPAHVLDTVAALINKLQFYVFHHKNSCTWLPYIIIFYSEIIELPNNTSMLKWILLNVPGDKHDETLMDVNELFFMNPVSRFQLHGVQENGTSYYLDLENLILMLVLLVLRHIDIDGDVIESLVNFTANLYMTGGHCWGIISIMYKKLEERILQCFFFRSSGCTP